ncbi:MAG: hypothetical protein JXX28_00075 [Deltaproteobacteria bacterium]|nr:hypothetical protein [Deltaproteobacteria bacterium]
MRFGIVTLVMVLAGCSSKTVDGTLIDGLTQQPLAGKTLVASAEGVSLTCQKVSANTDDAGKFVLEGACLDDAAYQLKVTDENLWLETAEVPQGGYEGPTQFIAWRAPKGDGIYALSGDTLTMLRTDSDVKRETIKGTEEEVLYPVKMPDQISKVKAGDFLVATTKDLCDNTKIVPVFQDQGVRTFADDSTIQDWWYIGVKFSSDTEFERTVASWDKSKEVHVEKGDRAFCFLPVNVLTAGRYSVMKEGDKRVRMMDVEG